MSCHICAAAHSYSHARLLCPTCARNRLYRPRLENTQLLLEKEALGRQVEASLSLDTPPAQSVTTNWNRPRTDHESSRWWAVEAISSQQAALSNKREDINQQVKALKEEIKAKKSYISERKAALFRRRSDAKSARYQLEEREAVTLTGIQNTSKRTEHLWHSLHSKTAEARIFLCREAAHLYGLRQKTSRRNDARITYVLGGISMIDLREMNGKFCATPAQISSSLSNIARLLVLVSHYLSLRLPAEITLPHKNHPIPTIYSPAASYQSHELPDGVVASRSATSSPTTSKTGDARVQPRPRPLFIDKPLPRLAKEDPGTYALFLEGATLVAWDVAWLCRTQGINLASDSWEDVCNIGKSLWQLLVAPPAQTSNLMRAFAGRDTQARTKPTKDSPQTTIQRTKSFPMLGHYSHGTAHSFLGASEGTEFIRSWKLPTPTKIADKLKSSLLGEMASAEWELLEEKEWDDGTAEPNQLAVPVERNELSVSNSSTTQANLSEFPNSSTSPNVADEARRPKGTSGWTKLNSR
ncbi:hypothetical protein N7448_008275 [Penicillium atrosanguineum]|uniref:Autophagy-related protein 14 n=1 Tax=Penicillium atrosanguineum TaxID=1132637 RepID=A0A9W9GR99_9EURO|nr:uncharacterized protein N7443_000711 [Penicillium atrosanguineum]KAJ5127496.1 hypothetical protein N7448_008275 [Penicillium atrosanguineum]KAJ5147701.1 hypothetical protein N7526_001053 [Penicillium atrosanguineum]KAJ5313827.1 hypothetical protein N7443_000711 [Penicillium atrosanguineum]KAJ5330998.1 hypothetical protein N7476_000781 [Penicillium atrosanguineum]